MHNAERLKLTQSCRDDRRRGHLRQHVPADALRRMTRVAQTVVAGGNAVADKRVDVT